eukprot:6474953-Amphidinium_carterae.1
MLSSTKRRQPTSKSTETALESAAGRPTVRPIEIGNLMQIKTTYKQRHTNIILDKPACKQRHFRDFSIISTEQDLNEHYAVTMLEYYYQDCKRHDPDDPPYRQRFVSFMIIHHYDKMKTLMLRARCTRSEINQTYEFYRQGPPGHDRVPIQQQPLQEEKGKEDDNIHSTYGDSGRISSAKDSERDAPTKRRGKQTIKGRLKTRIEMTTVPNVNLYNATIHKRHRFLRLPTNWLQSRQAQDLLHVRARLVFVWLHQARQV